MRRRRQPPSDPMFAAEMEALVEARRLRDAGRTGSGRPVGADGQPGDAESFHRHDHFPHVQDLRSVFRPSGDAR